MIAVVLGFLAATLVGLVGLHGPSAPPPRGDRFASTFLVSLAAIAIAAAFALQLMLIAHAARTQVPFPPWFGSLPFIAIDDRSPLYGHAPIGATAGLCMLAQTIAAIALYRAGRDRRFGRAATFVVGFACAIMLAAAVATPALTSFDLYAYVGSANIPDPYNPPRQAFAGDYGLINRIYGVPIFPSPYGPAWLALSKLVLAPFHTLGAQLTALRVLGACALLATLGALRAMRFSAVEIALIALNPALVLGFVLDGHNDIVAIALVLWAMALRQRVPLLAVALGVLAGGIKLPFLALGALAFARAETFRLRIVGAATIAATGIALSLVFGGSAYADAIRTTSRLYRAALADPGVDAMHVLLAVCALGAIVLAIIARRYWPSASWSFVALAAAFFGWYVAWGLPYAVLERRWFPVFAISLPALTFLLSTFYSATVMQSWSLTIAIAGAPIAVYLGARLFRARRT